jgi:hypothetical protein
MQPFASNGTIATGINGNDSTITFDVEGAGGVQWVSFYYQSKLFKLLDMNDF